MNRYLHSDYVNDYIKDLIFEDPQILVRILDSYVPTSWGMESGTSRKSDFKRDQYNNLTGELDASIVLSLIQNHFPQVMDIPDDFPSVHDDDTDKGLLFLTQFVWLHQYVLRESESEHKSHDSAKQD